MSNKLSIRFYLNKQKKAGEKNKIYCRIIVDRVKAEFYIGFAVSLGSWNELKRSTDNPEINAEIAEIESQIYRVRRNLIDNQIPLTASNIVEYYKGNKSTRTYTIGYFSEHRNYIETKGELSKVTISQYKTTLKIITQFINKYLKKHDILLTEVNFKFLQDLDSYMLNEYKDPYKRNIERNTVNKHHSRLRFKRLKLVFGNFDMF